jgi:signal transduction histidine kinase
MSNPSIRHRLLVSLITTIIFCWLIAALFVYQVASQEVEEIYDATLAQESRILATLMLHEIEEDNEVREALQGLVEEIGEDTVTRSSRFMKVLQEFHTHQVDLQQETINVIASIAGLALEKDIEISYDGPTEMVEVPGFSPAIQILLRNLIDNAIRYTPNNGEVTVKLIEQNDGAKIEVNDTDRARYT